MYLHANHSTYKSDDTMAVIEQEGHKAADNRTDDGAVEVEAPIQCGVHFRLKPIPFLLGFCFGAALYFLLSLLLKGG